MPFYDYTCSACDARIEINHSMNTKKRKCPECGKLKLVRDICCPTYHDTYSPMNPRRGRGKGGAGRVDPGEGMSGMGKNF